MEDSGIHPMPLFLITQKHWHHFDSNELQEEFTMRAHSHGSHGQAHLSEYQERCGISEKC